MKAELLEQAFRSNLKAIRMAKGVSQTQLAKSAKTSQNHISELENGVKSPTLGMIQRICQALEIDSNVLLTEDGAEIFLSAVA